MALPIVIIDQCNWHCDSLKIHTHALHQRYPCSGTVMFDLLTDAPLEYDSVPAWFDWLMKEYRTFTDSIHERRRQVYSSRAYAVMQAGWGKHAKHQEVLYRADPLLCAWISAKRVGRPLPDGFSKLSLKHLPGVTQQMRDLFPDESTVFYDLVTDEPVNYLSVPEWLLYFAGVEWKRHNQIHTSPRPAKGMARPILSAMHNGWLHRGPEIMEMHPTFVMFVDELRSRIARTA
jgi:hypothetical protein